MLRIALCVLVATGLAVAGHRTAVVKVPKADTTVVTKQDTVIKVDTLMINQTWIDTSILVKSDTTKAAPKKAAPEKAAVAPKKK